MGKASVLEFFWMQDAGYKRKVTSYQRKETRDKRQETSRQVGMG